MKSNGEDGQAIDKESKLLNRGNHGNAYMTASIGSKYSSRRDNNIGMFE